MKLLLIFVFALLFVDCGSKKEMLNTNTYLLTVKSSDSSYAFTKDNPVKVGGVKKNEGPLNERRFLNALLGPNGEKVQYNRAGSCCYFETPNGYNKTGLLDRYEVWYKGCKDTVSIYINMYDKGNLYIPVGFKARAKP